MEHSDELIQVLPAAPRLRLLLGKGRETGAPLVWTSFLLRQPTDEGLLLYNTLTLELLHVPSALLPALEAPTGALRDTLRRKWFLVPQDLDQHAAALELRSTLQEMEPPAEQLKKYTVFTTTACNARCFYCYEKDWTPRTMSLETADKLTDYMLAHSGGTRFQIDWFGGEPLVNVRVIDRICSRLQEARARYCSQMTSNGFLFDTAMIARAKELWKLEKVQITLDGMGETYDRIKDYKTDGKGAFRRVTDNISALAAAGIVVHIRMNYELYNLPEIEKLADWLVERYRGIPRVAAYPAPLFEDPDNPDVWHTEAERDLLCAAELDMRDRMEAGGLRRSLPLSREPELYMCMADRGSMITVLPDGEIGLCQNYDSSGFIGSLDGPALTQQELYSGRILREEIPACSDCPIYPGCIRLKLCPNQICYPQRRHLREEIKKRSMLMEWKQYQHLQGRTNE
ncbi:MAG: radical SAM protein [Oscillospiraceae bacterium]|nr:radical SAM protein [Oscillospiraceae bacterium]